jgi:surface antigen
MLGGGDKTETTGSISAASAKPGDLPPEGDLVFAKAAASDVLARGAKDSSASWENPRSGARGTVTPIASSYNTSDGQTCRDFLASYVKGNAQAWLQGAACKPQKGVWEVRSLKPWRQS